MSPAPAAEVDRTPVANAPSGRGRRRRSTAPLLALGLLPLPLWIVDLLGGGAPAAVDRVALLLAGAAWALLLAGAARRALRARPAATSEGRALRILFLLVGLALLVRLAGIGHEAAERYYLDEGAYIHNAHQVNAGEPLRVRFVYPHLLYYLYALTIWAVDLFRPWLAPLAERIWGWTDGLALEWVACRTVTALLSASATWPAFRLGERLGGCLGGALGALLLIGSTRFNDGSHLLISDVPSAVFAAWCLLFVARLAERERLADYALAGVFAGLAATAKYPAGTVAVAIAGVWLAARLRRERLPGGAWGLPLAAGTAIATFVATMPSIVPYWEIALHDPQGVFFGVRQYAQGGWLGVVPDSRALWYLGELRADFGWLPPFAAAGGLFALDAGRRRWLWAMLPFPIGYFWLISAMNIAVERNLYPIHPPLAGLLGGLAGAALAWAGSRLHGRVRRPAVALGALALVAWPLGSVALQDVRFSRPGTRVLARDWIVAHLPRESRLYHEGYTPAFAPDQIETFQMRFVPQLDFAAIESERFDWVLVSDWSWYRYFVPDEELGEAWHFDFRRAYQTIFDEWELVAEWEPSPLRAGPTLRLYRTPWSRFPAPSPPG